MQFRSLRITSRGAALAGTSRSPLGLEALHTLLGRARAQVPLPVLLEPMRSERVAEEVEALLAGVFQRGLRLIESERELCPRIAHPRQRLGGTAATEDA